jgi:hypothetical protein
LPQKVNRSVGEKSESKRNKKNIRSLFEYIPMNMEKEEVKPVII